MGWDLYCSGDRVKNPANNNFGDFPCTLNLKKILGRDGIPSMLKVQSFMWSENLVTVWNRSERIWLHLGVLIQKSR